jgi:DNA-binding MarR family transcriptional regulator
VVAGFDSEVGRGQLNGQVRLAFMEASEGLAGEGQWLVGDEVQAWWGLVSMIVRLPAALDRQLQRDAGISHFEYQVLAGLSMRPEHTMRMSDLAEIADGSLSRLSHTVSRLERRGWVRRTPDPADGRFTLAILTDDGWAKVVATAPGHVGAVRTYVFDPLTKAQVRQLIQIGDRISRAIDPDGPCPSERFPGDAS